MIANHALLLRLTKECHYILHRLKNALQLAPVSVVANKSGTHPCRRKCQTLGTLQSVEGKVRRWCNPILNAYIGSTA